MPQFQKRLEYKSKQRYDVNYNQKETDNNEELENDIIEKPSIKSSITQPIVEYLPPPPTSSFAQPTTENLFPFTSMQTQVLEMLSNLYTFKIFQTIEKVCNYTSLSKIQNVQIRLQMDGGANTSLTNRLDLLSTYWKINSYKINSITDNAPVECTH